MRNQQGSSLLFSMLLVILFTAVISTLILHYESEKRFFKLASDQTYLDQLLIVASKEALIEMDRLGDSFETTVSDNSITIHVSAVIDGGNASIVVSVSKNPYAKEAIILYNVETKTILTWSERMQ
ncbi:hypothetical protein FLK61_29870 [Paenalkalicoccus suaedae]|uniref:ComG operon protein 7 n=1 Tax=Paenalkalicoccus suaedae TaxID=2592382 RepID=A0A859FC66_9BACI|nr:hypothetical protein [Paenalkalicoccus suaedae]QKS70933.1 hypothetical protein FLK61_29870 [Paenalkalicoccus suaedae]